MYINRRTAILNVRTSTHRLKTRSYFYIEIINKRTSIIIIIIYTNRGGSGSNTWMDATFSCALAQRTGREDSKNRKIDGSPSEIQIPGGM